LLPTVNVTTFNIALAHFAKAVGASETRRILLVLDGAGWHKSRDVEWPTGVHPIFLPPYSPELQPAERLWPLVREAPANRLVRSLDELESIVVDRCQRLTGMPDHLRACTRLPWWPDA
jgi:transposase